MTFPRPSLRFGAALVALIPLGFLLAPPPGESQAQTEDTAAEQNARFFHYEVGDVRLTVLNDGLTVMGPFHPFLGANEPASTVQEAASAVAPPKPGVVFNVSGLLVRTPSETVLIDTGYGPFARNSNAGHMPSALSAAGVDPSEVDRVLITHNHIDHTGGLLGNDKNSARFPNATVHMAQAEIDYWSAQQVDLSQTQIPQTFRDFLKTSAKTVLDTLGDKVRPVSPGDEVSPGIVAVAVPGHTPGHIGFQIALPEEGPLFYMGDAAHYQPLQFAHPSWYDGADSDPTRGVMSRETLFAQLADSKMLVVGPHMPFPAIGRISRTQYGYRWNPLVWSGSQPQSDQ